MRETLITAVVVSLGIFGWSQSAPPADGSTSHAALAATNISPSASVGSGGVRNRWGESFLQRAPEWYSSAAAREVAENVLQYQTDQGAWPKNTDLAARPRSAEYLHEVRTGCEANTIDNGATTTPMRFLALVAQAPGEEKYRAAFVRGLDYLFAAQWANGGWPQFFPLRDRGYYSHVTYNDNAMMNVMFLLREVAAGSAPFAFVDKARRDRAAAAVVKGIDCILRTQIKQNGKLTAWCAQYDEKTLEPAWARNYEPPSLSGDESVAIVRFLLGIEKPAPEVTASIEGAIAWFKAVAIPGLRYRRGIGSDGRRDGWIQADPTAGPLWARFYEIGSNRPIFAGRDRKIHYSYDAVERERRGGYNYYGDWPTKLLERDYPNWLEKRRSAGLKANTSIKVVRAVSSAAVTNWPPIFPLCAFLTSNYSNTQ